MNVHLNFSNLNDFFLLHRQEYRYVNFEEILNLSMICSMQIELSCCYWNIKWKRLIKNGNAEQTFKNVSKNKIILLFVFEKIILKIGLKYNWRKV